MVANKDVVIVTGSSGFIGSALVRRLAEDFAVIGFDRFDPRQPVEGATYDKVDLTSDGSVAAALGRVRESHGRRIASVIHLAAYFDLSGKPDPRYEAITVRGTERLLASLQAFDVEQFVFSSTMLVHAPGERGRPIDEDWPLEGKQPYAESKIRTEALVRDKRGDIPAVLLRPAGVYDEMCHAAFLAQQIARIYERRLTGKVYAGDPDTGQPYLHLEDLADAVHRLVHRRKSLPPELPLLLGEREAMSYEELQTTLGRLIHGEAWATHEIPKPIAKAGAWVEDEVLGEDPFIKPWMVESADDHYELDTSRARELLGWTPRHALRATLPKMVEALKADPQRWYEANKLNPAVVAGEEIEVAERQGEGPDLDGASMHAHHQDMRRMHFNMLWAHLLNVGLGLWLVTSPFVFGTFDQTVFPEGVARVTEARGLWEPSLRSELTAWNDVACGLLIMLFGALSLNPKIGWAQWANTAVGVWLLHAPLIFWTPSAAVYANDTLIGALVITFAILVPMMPGMSHAAMIDQSDTPPGWTYSPSTYLQRIPIIALGAIGFVIARTLAAYQLGHTDGVWEPFFGGPGGQNGTEHIITSDVSKAWPIADGGLGAVTYMFEVLMGAMGDRRRWRTMPWMVVLFGIVVVPLGVVSIYFIIIQPIVIGTYCTLCLIAALAMLVMIPYSLDELVAMGQFMAAEVKRGRPFWRSFLQGDALPGGSCEDRPGFDAPIRDAVASAARGVSVPWTLVVSALIGVWLMFSRVAVGTEGPMADSDHLVGALVITFAVIAMAEVGRALRLVNVLFGLWLVVSPLILDGAGLAGGISAAAAGLVLIGLSLPRGRLSGEHYGGWDRFVV